MTAFAELINLLCVTPATGLWGDHHRDIGPSAFNTRASLGCQRGILFDTMTVNTGNAYMAVSAVFPVGDDARLFR
jgi:hypothetical protein